MNLYLRDIALGIGMKGAVDITRMTLEYRGMVEPAGKRNVPLEYAKTVVKSIAGRYCSNVALKIQKRYNLSVLAFCVIRFVLQVVMGAAIRLAFSNLEERFSD